MKNQSNIKDDKKVMAVPKNLKIWPPKEKQLEISTQFYCFNTIPNHSFLQVIQAKQNWFLRYTDSHRDFSTDAGLDT